MNGEILSVLDHLEREKGIKRAILIEAVETALVSAARKAVKNETGEVVVKFDPATGHLLVTSDGVEVASKEFGRIAAQTAKQVIIQKIREAEREVVYTDFQGRLGDITNGMVHRFEKGGVIVDLGRAEALLPKSEQSPKEEYRQGDRVRAYILDVKRTSRGPQIILSRTHAGLVKKLFELEVPEIYEGIVEIKAVSREAGDRSKIAVWSKDEKVDCVGACVGMRGSRVKNIVRELQGEKIDIVRWNEDVREYLGASLSPARVSGMGLDEPSRRVEVIVDDDQLSLAIGKRGQNVRLAAKLTGWNIDIRSKSQVEARNGVTLESLDGVGPKTAALLTEAGLGTAAAVAHASVEALTAVKGIGPKKAEHFQQVAREAIYRAMAAVSEQRARAAAELAQAGPPAEGATPGPPGAPDAGAPSEELGPSPASEAEGPGEKAGEAGAADA